MIKKCSFLILFFTINIQAQDFASKIRPVELYAQFYACNYLFKGDPYSAFQKAIPSSSLLQESGSNSDELSYLRATGSSTRLSFGIGVPVNIFNSTKFKNVLRIGYDNLGNVELGGGNTYENRVRIDSTYYPEYNASLIKDSVFIKHYGAVLTGKVQQVNADLLFRFRPDKIFTLYSGLGIGVAITTNRNSIVTKNIGSYTEVNSTVINSENQHGYYPGYSEYPLEEVATETFKLKTAYSIYSYIPFGMDWKLSNKDNVLSKFHLYVGCQFGARLSDVYLNTKQTTFFASGQTGIRVTI